MTNHQRPDWPALRRRAVLLGLPASLALATHPTLAVPIEGADADAAPTGAFRTTADYLVEFYPLWFTFYQSLFSQQNALIGPDRVSPLYQVVVAINVDTIYASSFLDLTVQPAVLTVPSTGLSYSVLSLDPYGTVLDTAISGAGRFGLVGPGYTGPLPGGVTRTPVRYDYTTLIFRIDKFSGAGVDQTAEALAFRRALKLQPLSAYLSDPAGGGTQVVPEVVFSVPFKTTADRLASQRPIAFLRQLQRAVNSPKTPPLSPAQQTLAARFDRLFANRLATGDTPRISAGARAGHRLIIDHYLSQRGPTNWIHFTNVGNWESAVLDRAGITEFIQYANDIGAAAYYHVFRDAAGAALQGAAPAGYLLKFARDQIPEAKRFWSVTAYTPDSVELIRNPAGKYAVASYTPGLVYDPRDGSLSIFVSRVRPAGVPVANWLPVGTDPFNLMLRVYGPEGAVAANTYVPPAVRRR
jgi:hypothetical protein